MPVPDLLHSAVPFQVIKVKLFLLPVILILICVSSNESKAQWVNNPAENTRVVFDLAESNKYFRLK